MFVSTSAPHLKRRGEAIFFAPMGGGIFLEAKIFFPRIVGKRKIFTCE